MSEYDWVSWVFAFAKISAEADSDMKTRMSLLEKAAKKRLEHLAKKAAAKELSSTAAPKANP